MERQQNTEDINFQKYWQILKHHKLPATGIFILTVILATIFALCSEKKYEAHGKLKFSKENTTSALVTKAAEKLGTLDTLGLTSTPVDTEAEVIKSAPIVNKVIKELDLSDKKGEPLTYDDFLESFKVVNVPGTDILTIAYRSADTQEAKSVINSIIKAYLAYDVDTNRTEASTAREFIGKQLPETKKQLEAAESELRAFQERYKLVNLDEESKVTVTQMGDIEDQIEGTKAALQKVNGQIQEIELQLGMSSQDAIARNIINDSPVIQQLLKRLKTVEDSLASDGSRFEDQNPIIISLKAEKAELEKALQARVKESLGTQRAIPRDFFQVQTGDVQETLTEDLVTYEAERRSLVKQLDSLTQSQREYRQRANLFPEVKQKSEELQRKVDVARSTYKNLINNLQQIEIAEKQNVGNAELVNEAVVGKYPVSISRKLILAGGMGVGSILAVITAFILELKNPSCKTTEELRQRYNFKLLGTIPNQQSQNFLGFNAHKALPAERSVIEEPYSIASEAYRMLHTNLQFLNHHQDVKVVTISSSIPQEGKSTVSANLAASISQMGKKVLVIDADLHKPQQHQIWGTTNNEGLGEVLRGEIALLDAIKSITPDLDIITAGLVRPGEALYLLQPERIESLIDSIKEEYDLIIFDTPPVLLFADALTISKKTDGIVLVGRPGRTSPASASASKELLEQSGQNILGLVVNSVEEESDNYARYAKDYYYNNPYQLKLPQKTT